MKPSLSRKIKQRTNKRVRELPEYVEDYIFENKNDEIYIKLTAKVIENFFKEYDSINSIR